jgi:hypothetical protein
MKAGGQHAHVIFPAGERQRFAAGREPRARYPEPARLELAPRRESEGAAIRGLVVAAALSTPFWLAVYFLLR